MSEQLSSSECLALLVGCLCHDLDHRGTNNEFQMKYVLSNCLVVKSDDLSV